MNRKIILSALLLLMAFVTAACSKDDGYDENNMIVGSWLSTGESSEITIAGQSQLPDEALCFIFTNGKVEITDFRNEMHATRSGYNILRSGDALWLFIDNSIYSHSRIAELTDDRLVLEDDGSCIDWGYHLAFRRGMKQQSAN